MENRGAKPENVEIGLGKESFGVTNLQDHNIHTEPELGLDIMRHSAAHLLAAAVLELWPDAKFGIGPTIRDGFYYDFDLSFSLTPDLLEQIEKKMKELQKQRLPYEQSEVPIDEAIALMEEAGQSYKTELLHDLKTKGTTAVVKGLDDPNVFKTGMETVTLYRLGNFVDLCRGPHMEHSAQTGFFKLTSVSGAYWRGDEKNKQLQRIYGTSFETKADLKEYLARKEEAKKRDHRCLGEELKIFTFSEEIGAGLPLWLPNGTIIRHELEKLAMEEERKDGYQRVATPHLTKADLYYRSGHLPYYREDMYEPINIEGQEYFLKPMNCPHHHHIYSAEPRSYRDLPVRLAEYGTVYRFEQSGSLNGILRTRGFVQNDAHIYCTEDQAKDEFLRVMQLHERFYRLFGIKNFYMRLSLPDMDRLNKFVDDSESWTKALKIIKAAMEESGLPYVEAAGEAAFYGPKVDFQIESVMGTEYTMSTNQLDFLAAKRFNLEYVGSDGQKHPVYVIHRAPLGSHERFIAFLLEHYAGKMPVWLAPEQVSIIPIAERNYEYAKKIHDLLFSADVPTAFGGVRVQVNHSNESMQKRIRAATMKKIPYMLVVGDREQESGSVSVRTRSGVDLKSMPVEAFLERITKELKTRQDLPVE
ncbi:MAG: threonine--tRNA ligase [Deltaproteobacteria bacterium]|nr:threonine--tRNA ligase [Deltaproteobacteria bacterium]